MRVIHVEVMVETMRDNELMQRMYKRVRKGSKDRTVSTDYLRGYVSNF